MPENNAEREPAPKMNESTWEKKRKALLERIRQPNDVTSEVDGERIEEERARLVLEVQRLEGEKDSMVRRLKDLRRQLEERRTEAQGVYRGSEEIRRSLLPVLAQEKDTLGEIEFLESLRQENDEHHRRLAVRVDSNMSTISYVIKKIEFMKGEMTKRLSWLPELPLAAEGAFDECYSK